MFNVAVFRMKDMIKYFVGITITILIVIATTKYFLNHKTDTNHTTTTNIIEKQVQKILSKSYVQCMNTQISSISKINQEQNIITEAEEFKNTSYLKKFIKTEISSIKSLENMKEGTKEKQQQEENSQEIKEQEETEAQEKTETQTQTELAEVGQKTEIITVNPIKETFNTQYRKSQNKKWNKNKINRRNNESRKYHYKQQKCPNIPYTQL